VIGPITLCRTNPGNCCQPFAKLSLGQPSAIGDRESLFVDTAHRMLHALWAQPVVENDATVTRVFHAAAKLR